MNENCSKADGAEQGFLDKLSNSFDFFVCEMCQVFHGLVRN